MHQRAIASLVAVGAALSLLGAGCKMVPVDEGSEDIRVIDAAEASACTRVGNGKFSVLDKVIGISRSREKIENDLVKLARNEALEMGANAVLPEGEIEKGQRRFGMYRCPTP